VHPTPPPHTITLMIATLVKSHPTRPPTTMAGACLQVRSTSVQAPT
jgi:hypothetical protein